MSSILLVDKETLVRTAIKGLINSSSSGFRVVGEAGDYDTALSLADQLQPSLIVVDLDLPGPTGLELLYELRRRENRAQRVVLTRTCSEQLVGKAIAAGALSCVLKDSASEDLFDGLRSASQGKAYLCPALAQFNSEKTVVRSPTEGGAEDPLCLLSPRERQIFHLLASGMQNAVIAKKLFISPRTVETHRARIVRKLGLASNAELIRYAIRNGLTFA